MYASREIPSQANRKAQPLITSTSLITALLCVGAFHVDYRHAANTHQRTQKPLVIVVGSFDCPPCVRMRSEIRALAKRGIFDNIELCTVGFDKDKEVAHKLRHPQGRKPVTRVYWHRGAGKYDSYMFAGYIDARRFTTIRQPQEGQTLYKPDFSRPEIWTARKPDFGPPRLDYSGAIQVCSIDELPAKCKSGKCCCPCCGGCKELCRCNQGAGGGQQSGFSFYYEKTTWKEEGRDGREVEAIRWGFDFFNEVTNENKALPADILKEFKSLIKGGK